MVVWEWHSLFLKWDEQEPEVWFLVFLWVVFNPYKAKQGLSSLSCFIYLYMCFFRFQFMYSFQLLDAIIFFMKQKTSSLFLPSLSGSPGDKK